MFGRKQEVTIESAVESITASVEMMEEAIEVSEGKSKALDNTIAMLRSEQDDIKSDIKRGRDILTRFGR
ncbi:MAG: hypothetical protein ACK5MV_00095 [Aminipila sp.]